MCDKIPYQSRSLDCAQIAQSKNYGSVFQAIIAFAQSYKQSAQNKKERPHFAGTNEWKKTERLPNLQPEALMFSEHIERLLQSTQYQTD